MLGRAPPNSAIIALTSPLILGSFVTDVLVSIHYLILSFSFSAMINHIDLTLAFIKVITSVRTTATTTIVVIAAGTRKVLLRPIRVRH